MSTTAAMASMTQENGDARPALPIAIHAINLGSVSSALQIISSTMGSVSRSVRSLLSQTPLLMNVKVEALLT